MIKENIELVKKNIAEAYARSPYHQGEVMLLAVSKTVPPERIREALDAGQSLLGENRVQELLDKYEALPGAGWHIIGHLQRNKVKYIIDKAAMIESLDSLELAREIERQAVRANVVMPVLVQVNIDADENKFGIAASDCADFLRTLTELPHLRVMGLMTIGCLYSDERAKAADTFAKMKKLFDEMSALAIDGIEMKYLSMGMSHDYALAVEHGANIVRVGSAIFGERE